MANENALLYESDGTTGGTTLIKDMGEAQKHKMVLDLCRVAETNVSLIKLIISTLRRCQTANVAVKLVASPKQGEELKSFQETGVIL